MTTDTPIDLEALRRDLDALRARTVAKIGEEDAEYLKSVRLAARALEVSGRVLIHVSLEPVSFGLGVPRVKHSKRIRDRTLANDRVM
jgi:NADPH-dependent stearoyl-CoA 9-desaturase